MSTLVVKIGGHALDDLSPSNAALVALAHDILELREQNRPVVLVHGGGPQIDDLLALVGIESTFIDGLRVTDATTMHLVDLALAGVNRALVTALRVNGVAAAGLSGVDGGLLTATSVGEPWGHVAQAPVTQPAIIQALWSAGFTPVVSPVAASLEGARLNCNADTAAGALAGALHCEGLLLLSDIDQLRLDPDDPTSGLAEVSLAEVDDMILRGLARDGMRPKLAAAANALTAGAQRVWLANGTVVHALRDVLNATLVTTEVRH
jgi:acetylglutamate kinase